MRLGTNFSFPTRGEKRRGEFLKGRYENKGEPTAKSYRKNVR